MKRISLFSFALLACLACAKSRVDLLSDRTEMFNQSLRWASLKTMTPMIAQENRRTLLEKLAQHLNKNRIVDYAILDLGLDKKKKKGSVLVEFSYYGVSDQTLHYRKELQSWKYNSRKKNWFLVDAKELPTQKQK